MNASLWFGAYLSTGTTLTFYLYSKWAIITVIKLKVKWKFSRVCHVVITDVGNSRLGWPPVS